MPDTIGFIGLGHMGAPMARRLIAAGQHLAVHDQRPEAGAALADAGVRVAASARAVGDLASVVFLSLPGPEEVREATLGADGLAGAARAATVVDLSTVGTANAERIAADLARRGITYLDAPVSGGVAGAMRGTLAVMAAGAAERIDTVAPLLEHFGRVFRVGERPGMGQSMKLINNLLSATALAATSEAAVLGVKAGLDPEVMIEVINAGSGRNSASLDKFPRNILPRRFDAGFTVGLINKDLKLCFEEAERLQMPLAVGAAVRQVWLHTLEQGAPGRDFTTVIRHLEGRAGVRVAGHDAGEDPPDTD